MASFLDNIISLSDNMTSFLDNMTSCSNNMTSCLNNMTSFLNNMDPGSILDRSWIDPGSILDQPLTPPGVEGARASDLPMGCRLTCPEHHPWLPRDARQQPALKGICLGSRCSGCSPGGFIASCATIGFSALCGAPLRCFFPLVFRMI